jgi:hypothetical protein
VAQGQTYKTRGGMGQDIPVVSFNPACRFKPIISILACFL